MKHDSPPSTCPTSPRCAGGCRRLAGVDQRMRSTGSGGEVWRRSLHLLPKKPFSLFTEARRRDSRKSVALLEPELLRSERPPEPFPGSLDELRGAYDPLESSFALRSLLWSPPAGARRPPCGRSCNRRLSADEHRGRSFPYVRRASARRMAVRSLGLVGPSFRSCVARLILPPLVVGRAHLPKDYSPECVGGVSSEAELPLYAVLRSTAR